MNTEKATLRTQLRAQRRALPDERRAATDRAITELFFSSNLFWDADCILLYAAVDGEVNLMRIASEALAEGKVVAFPRTEDGGIMHFHAIRSLLDLEVGAYGIPTPRATMPVVTPNEKTLMLVPALAYDHAGHRLGQGGGFYDRYLSAYSGMRVGIIREDAYLPTLPHEPHDQTVNMIITEKQIYKVN